LHAHVRDRGASVKVQKNETAYKQTEHPKTESSKPNCVVVYCRL